MKKIKLSRKKKKKETPRGGPSTFELGVYKPVNLNKTDEFGYQYVETSRFVYRVGQVLYRMDKLPDDSFRFTKVGPAGESAVMIKPSAGNAIVIK